MTNWLVRLWVLISDQGFDIIASQEDRGKHGRGAVPPSPES